MAKTISGTSGINPGALPFLVGELKFLTGTTVPAGFITAAGQTLSRTAYPLLWEYASTSGNLAATEAGKTKGQYGPGDGSTTFSVPDVRSEFIRALDLGAGVDTDRVIGSSQAASVETHFHYTDGRDGSNNPPSYAGGDAQFDYYSGRSSTADATYRVGSRTANYGDTETKPRNVAFLACIFAGA